MDIEIGDYIRTDNGEIYKVIDIEKGSIKIKSDYKEWIGMCCITKHSKIISELIEVGDYVNGYIIEKIGEAGFGRLAYWKQYDRKWTYIDENDIKTIVTKEMMKSIEYRIN